MSSLSTNLLAAWGDGDSEPDPSTLPGLLAIAETRLEESVESFRALLGHFESIQQRVWEAKNNLEEMLAKAGQLPKEMAEAGQDNLEAFDELVGLLEELGNDLRLLGPEDVARGEGRRAHGRAAVDRQRHCRGGDTFRPWLSRWLTNCDVFGRRTA